MSAFFAQNMVLVYFLYGLAFFSMGVAVLLESGRASELRLARAMGPLGTFGILHGVHEWLEMFVRLGEVVPDAPTLGQTTLIEALRVALLAMSFLLLIVFGVRLIHLSGHGRGNERTFVMASAGMLILVWLVSVMSTQQVYAFCLEDCLVSIDVLTRYILGIPGAILAAWAMLLEYRAFRERGMVMFGRDLVVAAAALLLYGVVGQLFVPKSVLFPANIINDELFGNLFGVPVQFFRALMAAIMAFFVTRALRAFELEHRQRLLTMQAAQRAAEAEKQLAQQRAHQQTEELNRELQTAVQELSLLFELTRSLVATLDSEALLHQTLQRIVDRIPHVSAGMILGEENEETPLAIVTPAGCETDVELDGLCREMQEVGSHVVRHREPAMQQNGSVVPAHIEANETGARSRVIGVPLHLHDATWGSLVLGTADDTPAFTAHDLSLLATVAGQLSMAVENATLYEEVQEREALRSELYQRIISAQEGERQRIARELHDGTGQVLTGLGLGLKAAAESVARDPELAAQQLLELKDLNASALQELRNLIADLRPSILDDLGLVPALQAQVKAFGERTGIQAAFDSRGRRRLSPEEEIVIFRITQEALTNVGKHAQAKHVMVRLTFADDATHLVVTDDGCGFNPSAALQAAGQRRAWGLLGMQERIMLVGGACEIASKPEKGTTVRVVVPHQDEGTSNEREDTPALGR
ncbi:MAG: GAF domain-containing sensor histidine kinase [Anaerolineae bacterium]|nr:GAF domain-containing sensor histidine kinase [Anaerolineae bacterium]